ncbi:hypothetical protein OS493_017767 [Desmophyllum pertusum]|uniref:Uncharacterized protein n=1 Tax=Desmophyllum pertusum TaxID=174260 RepID=A0A9X0CX66_9CNID|nr:hypothetical protein OS493_017767 [Desmophyllum pertusum]
MKGLRTFAVMSLMAILLHIGIASPHFAENDDIYSDFRGDEINSLRSTLDHGDFYEKARFEDGLKSRREPLFSCYGCCKRQGLCYKLMKDECNRRCR